MRAPLVVDERARREAGQPPALVAGELADQPQAGQQLVLIDAGRAQREAADQLGEELATPALRRWLRAVTAWQWYAPATAVELTDRDGRYAYISLDRGRLAPDGDRTRGPWTSHNYAANKPASAPAGPSRRAGSATTDEISANAAQLATTADELRRVVASFRLD